MTEIEEIHLRRLLVLLSMSLIRITMKGNEAYFNYVVVHLVNIGHKKRLRTSMKTCNNIKLNKSVNSLTN